MTGVQTCALPILNVQVLVKQEIYRKHGYSIQADDEQLRAKLETMYAELNAPMQFKVSQLFEISTFRFHLQ